MSGSSDRGLPSAGEVFALGEETTEIARIVTESAPGVERIPAAERVYAFVKSAILDRVYPGGELLTEGELADAVGVSRTPVREALLRLEASGLVKLYPKKGAMVLPVLPQEINDVLEALELVETHAAAKIWPARKQLAATVEPLLADLRTHRRSGDAKGFLEADRAVHEAIVRAAGNELLAGFHRGLRDRQLRMGGGQLPPARMDRSITAFQDLLDALRGNSSRRFRDVVLTILRATEAELRGL